MPADHIQAAAQVAYMKDNGVTKLYILNDKEVYGKGIADQVEKIAGEQGIEVAGNDGIDTKAANFRALASKIKSSGADGFFFGGITQNKGVQVFKDVAAANPDIKLFGPDGVAESPFSEKLGASVEKNVYITNPTLDPKEYPPAAQDFFKEFKAKYGKDPSRTRSTATRPWASRSRRSRTQATRATTARQWWTSSSRRRAGIGARHLRHRRERRHHAVRLRRKPHRGRQLVFDKVIKAQTQ